MCVVTERPRDDHGRLQGNAYSNTDFLDAVREGDLATTVDIAEAVGCERTTAYHRLTALEDDGQLESRKVGQSLVWSIAD